jgi:hypothetical protein
MAAAPAETSELGRVTQALADEDAFHDEAVRFGVGYLENIEDHHDQASERAAAQDLKSLLWPDGTSLVNKSYEEEAGRSAARDRVRTPEVRAKLERYSVPTSAGAISYDRWLDEVAQASANRLGAHLARRDALAAGAGPSGAQLLNDKRSLVALVSLIFSNFRRLEPGFSETDRTKLKGLRDVWNEAVKRATDRANEARRRRAAAGPGAPPTPPPA